MNKKLVFGGIILGVVLMAIGLLLMHFTKNDGFSIMYFIGILAAGVCIVIGLIRKKPKDVVDEQAGESKPTSVSNDGNNHADGIIGVVAPEDKTTNPIGDFIEGRVLEVRRLVDKFLYLIECQKEIFNPGETIAVSKTRKAIASILNSENTFYHKVLSRPQEQPVLVENPKDGLSNPLVFEE